MVAALWRFGVLVVDKWHQPLLFNDSVYYSAQARQLATGTFFREPFVDRPGAEHGPLTSTLLAIASWPDDHVPWQRLVTVLTGIATVVVVGLLGRAIGGRRVGIVAAWIAAVYPNLWMNDGLVMSESISVLVVSSTLLVAHRVLTDHHAVGADRPRPVVSTVVWLGVLVGLGALARSELALLAPGLALLLVAVDRGRGLRRTIPAAAMLLASLAVVAPWVIVNQVRFEESVTLTTNDGTTLLGSYCDDTFSGPLLGGWSILCVVADPAYSPDEEPSVRSARQRSLAIDYAREHIDELPKVIGARVLRTLDLYGLDELVRQDVGEERYRWASWAGIVSFWVLAPVAVVGALRLRRRERWLVALPCAAVLATTVLFYGAHRIRSSAEPVVVVGAAVAVVSALDRFRRRRHRKVDATPIGVGQG